MAQFKHIYIYHIVLKYWFYSIIYFHHIPHCITIFPSGGILLTQIQPKSFSHGQVPAASVKPDRPLMDLGFDSAGALRLRNKLARPGGWVRGMRGMRGMG